MMYRKRNTKQQNNILMEHILTYLARGETFKETCLILNVPLNTMRDLVKRHKKRHGFRTTYQMLAAFVTIQEQMKYIRHNKNVKNVTARHTSDGRR